MSLDVLVEFSPDSFSGLPGVSGGGVLGEPGVGVSSILSELSGVEEFESSISSPSVEEQGGGLVFLELPWGSFPVRGRVPTIG